jgi:microcystin-dependent protein
LGKYPAFIGKIAPFFDRPDVLIDFIWYSVPVDNPVGPATVFNDRFWEERDGFYPLGPSTVPGSLKVYRGPVFGPEVTPLIGSPDDWLTGLSYDVWQAGGYSAFARCIPVAPPCANLPNRGFPFYYAGSNEWVPVGLIMWDTLNGETPLAASSTCRWQSADQDVPGLVGGVQFSLSVGSDGTPTLVLSRVNPTPPASATWVGDPAWDGASPVLLSLTSIVGGLPAPATVLLSGSVYGWSMIPGLILPYGGIIAPPGTLICDGTAYPSGKPYDRLQSVIGNIWNTFRGAADPGGGFFRVPDLRGLAWAGSGNAVPAVFPWPGTSAFSQGSAGGEENHQLTQVELASHVHAVPGGFNFAVTAFTGNHGTTATAPKFADSGSPNTDTAGGDTPHNTIQPTAYGLWIITL